MRRVERRVQSRGSGCPVHKKQLLPRRIGATAEEAQSEQHALTGNTSASAASSCGMIPGTGSKRHSDGTFRGSAVAWRSRPGPPPCMRLRRKTFVSQLQDAHEPAETCDARYPGREDVFHGFDCAGAPRDLLQQQIALLRVQLGPTESAHGFGDTVSCPFGCS